MDALADLACLEGVASAMASARDGIDALLRDRGLRRTTPDVTAESLLLGAWASAVSPAPTSDEDDLREGRGDAVARPRCASPPSCSASPVLGRSPLQAFARLHTRRGRPTSRPTPSAVRATPSPRGGWATSPRC